MALLDGRLIAHGSVAETTTPEMLATLLGARLPTTPVATPLPTNRADTAHEVSS